MILVSFLDDVTKRADGRWPMSGQWAHWLPRVIWEQEMCHKTRLWWRWLNLSKHLIINSLYRAVFCDTYPVPIWARIASGSLINALDDVTKYANLCSAKGPADGLSTFGDGRCVTDHGSYRQEILHAWGQGGPILSKTWSFRRYGKKTYFHRIWGHLTVSILSTTLPA